MGVAHRGTHIRTGSGSGGRSRSRSGALLSSHGDSTLSRELRWLCLFMRYWGGPQMEAYSRLHVAPTYQSYQG
eukprot:scaffold1128_cov41-Attheya_sp.AAC.2